MIYNNTTSGGYNMNKNKKSELYWIILLERGEAEEPTWPSLAEYNKKDKKDDEV